MKERKLSTLTMMRFWMTKFKWKDGLVFFHHPYPKYENTQLSKIVNFQLSEGESVVKCKVKSYLVDISTDLSMRHRWVFGRYLYGCYIGGVDMIGNNVPATRFFTNRQLF